MKGKDLVNYIVKNYLEEADIDMMVSDNLQFVITIPANGVTGEREIIYDFTRNFAYEEYLSIREISYKEAKELRGIKLEEEEEKENG